MVCRQVDLLDTVPLQAKSAISQSSRSVITDAASAVYGALQNWRLDGKQEAVDIPAAVPADNLDIGECGRVAEAGRVSVIPKRWKSE